MKKCRFLEDFNSITNEERIIITALLLFGLKGIIISFIIVFVLQTYASFPLRVVVVAALSFAFIRHGLKPVFCPYRQHSFSLNLSVSLTHVSVLMISESYLGRYAVSPVVQSCAGIWVPLKETY